MSVRKCVEEQEATDFTTDGARGPPDQTDIGIVRFAESAKEPKAQDQVATRRKARSATAKRKKDDAKPDHPLSGYNFFFREERVRFLQEPKRDLEPGENRFTSMGKEIARRWKQLTREDAQKYHELAAKDLLRYRQEMEEYHASRARSVELVTKKKPDSPSVAPNLMPNAAASGWMELGSSGSLGAYSSFRSRLGFADMSGENALAPLSSHSQSMDRRYATASTLGRSLADTIGNGTLTGCVEDWFQGQGQRCLASTASLEAQVLSACQSNFDRSARLHFQNSAMSEQLLRACILSGAGGPSLNAGGVMGSVLSRQLASQQDLLGQYALLQLLANSSSDAASVPPSLALSSGMSNSIASASAIPSHPSSDLVTEILLRQLLDQQGEEIVGSTNGCGKNPPGSHK